MKNKCITPHFLILGLKNAMGNLRNKYLDEEWDKMVKNSNKTKTEQAKELYLSGQKDKALKVVKTFKKGLTKEEKRLVEIACECQEERNLAFFKRLNVYVEYAAKMADKICKRLLNIN